MQTGQELGRRARDWQPQIVAALAFAATCWCYFLGAGRSYDYDSGVTVGYFVATPSLLDPLRRERVFNNHPLLSFADHVVYSLGGRSETALRAFPIVAGAATVALIAWFATRHWGVLAGASAAAVTGSNALFADLSRAVRGYSLLTFATLASTIVLFYLLRRPTRVREAGYVGALAAGIATHLYGLLVFPIHAAVVIARGELSRRWAIRWLSGIVLGGLVWAGILGTILNEPGRSRQLAPSFGGDLARALLGGHTNVIRATALLMISGIALTWPPRRELVIATAVAVAMALAIWLVVQPPFLYPRFFVWLIPALGLLAGRAVGRWPVLAVLAAACLYYAAENQKRFWSEDPMPTRAAAQVFRAAAKKGLQPCVLGFIGESMAAYSPPPYREVDRASQLPGCEVTLSEAGIGPVAQARAALPYHAVLPALDPLEVDSTIPLSSLGRL